MSSSRVSPTGPTKTEGAVNEGYNEAEKAFTDVAYEKPKPLSTCQPATQLTQSEQEQVILKASELSSIYIWGRHLINQSINQANSNNNLRIAITINFVFVRIPSSNIHPISFSLGLIINLIDHNKLILNPILNPKPDFVISH